eukprot:c54124_g1_i1.p2 GENE.c54124_g1_i1~~c54124_g1_i1.p2  ORF type:complete len:127 (-),score=33.40 c54124_g1_i1:23-403(-)
MGLRCLSNFKLWIGFTNLPKRARLAFVAVALGLLLIAAQCCEKFTELVFQFMGMQAFHRPELTHILYRFLEAFVGFSITCASSPIFLPAPQKPHDSRAARHSEGTATTKDIVCELQDHALVEEVVV